MLQADQDDGLKSQLEALKHLFTTQERTASDQTKRLEDTLGQLNLRAQDLSRSEKALRNQTVILQSVLDSMGDAVVVVDGQGRFLFSNAPAEQILGGFSEECNLHRETTKQFLQIWDVTQRLLTRGNKKKSTIKPISQPLRDCLDFQSQRRRVLTNELLHFI